MTLSRSGFLLAVGLAAVTLGVSAARLQDQQVDRRFPDHVSQPISPVMTMAARNAPLYRVSPDAVERPVNPRRTYPRPGSALVPREDPPAQLDRLLALQDATAGRSVSRALSASLNLAGQGYSYVQPPDPVGAVGPSHYIQMINGWDGTRVTIHSKTTGAVTTGPFLLETLGSGGACSQGNGDPIVLYDRLANRWLLSEFASSGNHLCVYISQSADPAGAYYRYDFTTPDFPDYPKYAVWPDAYYVTTNEASPAVYALDRQRMLTGTSATAQRFTVPSLAGFPFQALTPGDLDGTLAPPSGATASFARHRDDEAHNPGANDAERDFLEVWQLDPDFAVPSNSVLSGPTVIGVTSFDSTLCGLTSFSCIPQPSGESPLDPLREVIMWRLQYRNAGIHETLVGNFAVDVNGADRAGIRWFELRKSGGGAWALHQEGTYAPDATHRWMGSIAMDGDGNIALGYSVSSSSVYPGLRVTGRLAGDPTGVMTNTETALVAGAGSNTSNRWGDYAAMSLDPSDDCTFWFTGQYSPTSQWGTRIARLKFDSCGAAASFTDDPLVPGVTPVRGVHITELRTRIASLRARYALPVVVWTDPTLTAGSTTIRAVHVTELRAALQAVYVAAGRAVPSFTDPVLTAGVTSIRAVHITELRAAVVAIE